jgi:hypothetical protein
MRTSAERLARDAAVNGNFPSGASPRRFLRQEPPDYGGRSADEKAAGDTDGRDVVIDDHRAALRVSHARSRSGLAPRRSRS